MKTCILTNITIYRTCALIVENVTWLVTIPDIKLYSLMPLRMCRWSMMIVLGVHFVCLYARSLTVLRK